MRMNVIKYSFDELNIQAQYDFTLAISKHREFCNDLGFPFAFWSSYEFGIGDIICAEFYDPETGKTRYFKYHKRDSGDWEWY
jgi:hypothetical protein